MQVTGIAIGIAMRRVFFSTVIFAILLGGCVPLTYRYDGRDYGSRAEAEAAAASKRDAQLAQIAPLPAPLADAARIIVPSKTAAMQRVIRGGTSEGRDYVGTVLSGGFRLWADAIARRNIFAKVEIEETDYPDHVETPAVGAVIYAYIAPDAKAFNWYYRTPTQSRTPIHYDRGMTGQKRLESFIEGVEALARQEVSR
jgi:hypothetical protein